MFNARIFQQHAMFQDRRKNLATIADRREWTDKGILNEYSFADDHRTTNRAIDNTAAGSKSNAAGDLALLVDLTVDASLDPFVKHDGVRREEIVFLSGIKPPRLDPIT